MPRKGKGQKVQTASGQQYGQAAQQERAQKVVPLAQEAAPVAPRMRPGAAGPFARPTERPKETGRGSTAVPDMRVGMDDVERMKIMSILPILSEIASMPNASPHLRNTVRKMRAQVGPVADFASKGYRQDG
jgi:hypothetical protein